MADGVLRSYNSYRQLAQSKAPVVTQALALEQLIYAMRRDLGHKNEHLGHGDLLSIFINDIDNLLSAQSAIHKNESTTR